MSGKISDRVPEDGICRWSGNRQRRTNQGAEWLKESIVSCCDSCSVKSAICNDRIHLAIGCTLHLFIGARHCRKLGISGIYCSDMCCLWLDSETKLKEFPNDCRIRIT